jgi:hypothetical protein
MSKWNFIKDILRNKLKNTADREYLSEIFSEATHNPEEMHKLRTRLDPAYEDFDKNAYEDILKRAFDDDDFSYGYRSRVIDENFQDFLDSGGGYYHSTPESIAYENLDFYRKFRDQKNYLNSDYKQQVFDNGYADFINYLQERKNFGSNDLTKDAYDYLYNEAINKDYSR